MKMDCMLRTRRVARAIGLVALLLTFLVLPDLPQLARAASADAEVAKKTSNDPDSRRMRIMRKRRMINELAERERQKLAEEAEKRKQANMQKKLAQEKEKQEGGDKGDKKGETGKKDGGPAPDSPTSLGPGRLNAPSYVLMLHPLNQSVSVGKRFMTTVRFRTDQAQPVDRIDIALTYPPLEVSPLKIYDYPLADYLTGDATTSSSIEQGILRYRARLSEPVTVLGDRDLVHIVWESVGESDNTNLVLGHSDRSGGRGSSVYYNDMDLLCSPWLIGQSCVNATVVSSPDAKQVRGLRILGETRHTALSDATDERRSKGEAITLDLLRPTEEPAVGEEFVVDVMVHNPDNLAFSEVRLAIGYDSSTIEVLDWDFMGWIKRGVNVFDAHAHTRYPFNIHNRNEVNPYRGRITYHMGTTFLRPMPSGSLCRIRCRALAPGARMALSLYPEEETADWYTDLRAGAESVLNRPARRVSYAARRAADSTP